MFCVLKHGHLVFYESTNARVPHGTIEVSCIEELTSGVLATDLDLAVPGRLYRLRFASSEQRYASSHVHDPRPRCASNGLKLVLVFLLDGPSYRVLVVSFWLPLSCPPFLLSRGRLRLEWERELRIVLRNPYVRSGSVVSTDTDYDLFGSTPAFSPGGGVLGSPTGVQTAASSGVDLEEALEPEQRRVVSLEVEAKR